MTRKGDELIVTRDELEAALVRDTSTPPAQAMTADEHAAARSDAQMILSYPQPLKTRGAGFPTWKDYNLARGYSELAAVRQSWEAERERMAEAHAATERDACVWAEKFGVAEAERSNLEITAASCAAKLLAMEAERNQLEANHRVSSEGNRMLLAERAALMARLTDLEERYHMECG